ncbi:beta-lactamase/transpeptidase-like protein [Cladorrhinum sp. PSN259]|nr:beta-lactamase/transpeptidase-like protein [Cladorrhinum sp. PSN259]
MASGKQADDSNKEKAAPIKDKATINGEKAALNKTLQSDKQKIESICRLSGVVGAIVTVIDDGAVVFKEGIGYRDWDTKEPVTAETIFPIAGLTESFTGFCLDQLRSRGKLSYTDAISAEDSDSGRATVFTIADLVAHRTGVREGSRIWEGAGGQVLLTSEQISTMFRAFIPRGSPRAVFNRCSLGYEILGDVIADVSGQRYHDYLELNVLAPLSMTRTITTNNNASTDGKSDNSDEIDWGTPFDDNHTQAYNVWGETNNPHPVPLPGVVASGPLGAAEGLLSTANDLSTFYKLLMSHWSIQNKLENGQKREAETMLVAGGDIRWLFTPLQVMETPTFREKSYATGWARSQLPGTVGNFTVNAELVEKMPILGAGILPPTKTRLALWNQGSLVGASHFVMLLPETESAVIVLTNTTTRNDAAHWIGQLLVETLLAKENDSQPRTNDYVRLAVESVSKARKKYEELTQDVQIGAVSGGPKRKLKEYVGMYVGIAGSFALEIVLDDDGKLEMRMQGRKTQGYTLSHHHDDTFTWFTSYDDQLQRGRRVHYHPTPFLIEFKGKPINVIRWIQDPVGRPDGELFVKKTGK